MSLGRALHGSNQTQPEYYRGPNNYPTLFWGLLIILIVSIMGLKTLFYYSGPHITRSQTNPTGVGLFRALAGLRV